MAKKKKTKHGQPVSPVELVRTAREKLALGQAQQAIEMLRSAESKLRQSIAQGKKVSVPPHLIALQAEIPGLMARASFDLSIAGTDPNRKIALLDKALEHVPDDYRNRLARCLIRLQAADSRAGLDDARKALELRPGDPLALRSLALALLAAGHAREARDALERIPVESRRDSWDRLANLVGILGGLDAQLPGTRRPSLLFDGLSAMARNDHPAALTILSDLQLPDQNPSIEFAALLATQLFYCGAINLILEEHSKAGNYFGEALRLADSHHLSLPWLQLLPGYLRTVAAALSTSDLELSQKCWRMVLALSPNDDASKSSLLSTGRIIAQDAWRKGETQKAVDIWRDALIKAPQDESLLKNLALGYEKLDQQPEALKCWRSLARLWRQQYRNRSGEPGFKERLVRLEMHLVRLMIEADLPPHEIASEIENAIKIDPENVELRLQTVESLLEIGRPQSALRHLEWIERERGTTPELLSSKGAALFQMNRDVEAEKVFELILEQDAENRLARNGLVILLLDRVVRTHKNRDYRRGIDICRKILAIEADNPPALLHLGTLLFLIDKHDEAIQSLNRLMSIHSDNRRAYLSAGEVLGRFHHTRLANKAFKRAIEIEPTYDTFHEIATVYSDRGDIKTAIKYFKQGADVADSDDLIDLAVHMFEFQREDEAWAYIEKAKQLDPDNPRPYMTVFMIAPDNPSSILRLVINYDRIRRDLEIGEQLAGRDPKYADDLKSIRSFRRVMDDAPFRDVAPFLEGGLPIKADR